MRGEVRWYDEVDSTNRVAAEWAAEGAREGSVVAARFQTGGRGRMGRTWHSPPGASLMFSLVLRPGDRAGLPSEPLPGPGVISLMAGVAVVRLLKDLDVQASIKWPNDVLVGEKKVCGVLGELVDTTDGGAVVLGIGLNVTIEDFPPEIARATSLKLETGRTLDPSELLDALLEHFGDVYRSAPSGVLDEYRSRCSTLGQQVRVETPGGVLHTTARDVDGSGALITDDGLIHAGDVVHLREAAGLGE